MQNIKIKTFNVRGLRCPKKREKIFHYLKQDKSPSIIGLQETYSSAEIEEQWTKEWGNGSIFNAGNEHAKGVAFLFNNIDYKIQEIEKDNNGRSLFIRGEFNGQKFSLINLYLPTANNVNDQINTLKQHSQIIENNFVITCPRNL